MPSLGEVPRPLIKLLLSLQWKALWSGHCAQAWLQLVQKYSCFFFFMVAKYLSKESREEMFSLGSQTIMVEGMAIGA